MKIVSLLFLTVFLGKGCINDKQDVETAVIEYEANTRGFYQKIVVQNHAFSVTEDREATEKLATKKISDADWKALVATLQKVNLEQMPNFKAPTEKRFHDGAAIASLKITYKDKVYESASFDHGFPPLEMETLVNKINAFAKK